MSNINGNPKQKTNYTNTIGKKINMSLRKGKKSPFKCRWFPSVSFPSKTNGGYFFNKDEIVGRSNSFSGFTKVGILVGVAAAAWPLFKTASCFSG